MLPFYRAGTERMLRRYFRLSLDLGRLPSILGGEVFRGVVSSSRMHTFEDFVIFVHDMERCMEKLDPASLETIAALVFLDQSQEEAGKSLGLSRRQVERRYSTALDRLSYRLLIAKLIQPLPLTLEQPDCMVCLRNPEFSARAEGSDTEDAGEGSGFGAAAIAAEEAGCFGEDSRFGHGAESRGPSRGCSNAEHYVAKPDSLKQFDSRC